MKQIARGEQEAKAIETIWQFHLMHQKISDADIIFVLGSHDLRTAKRAADLFNEGRAPLIIMSGKYGDKKRFARTEAEELADVAVQHGVPASKILLEKEATNTKENVVFTKQLLAQKGISVRRVLAVQKPYMERRTYATITKQWPEVFVTVTSSGERFDDYCDKEWPPEYVINAIVGDLQRLGIYSEKGDISPQRIPKEVWDAYHYLVRLGYDERVIKG